MTAVHRAPRPSRSLLRAALLGTTLSAALLIVTPAARAAASFDALAEAVAADCTVSNAGLPVVQTFELGAPYANSELTSFGQSRAIASDPYPGETGAGLPGLVFGLLAGKLGIAPPPVSYPAYVKAEAGDPPQDFAAPGMSLHAQATTTGSKGVAHAGGAGAGASADATSETVANADGSVLASANAHADDVQIPGGLLLRGVVSTASARREPNGVLSRAASTSIGSLTLPDGTGFAFRDGRFVAAGTSTPVPTSQVLSAFATAGLDITYEAQQDYLDGQGRVSGVRAPAISIHTVTAADPGTHQPSAITFRFGGTVAAVSYAADTGTAVAVSQPTRPSAGAQAPGSPTTPASPSAAAGRPSEGTRAAPPLTSTTAPLAQPAPTPAVAGPPSTPHRGALPASRSLLLQPDASQIYLVIVAGAVLALACAQLVRVFGVRLGWPT